MYVLIAGGGKAGANVMRSLLRLGHEVTLIEQHRERFERLEDEFEHQVMQGDATELFVLERAGIARPPDLVLALTGDDEDNMVIAQLAREKDAPPTGAFLVADDGERLVGCAGWRRHGDDAELKRMSPAKAASRRGLGRRML